jgi:sec-independent protein translocase protein TatA
MGNLRGYEWIILLLIVLLLFGAKRLPDTARGLGRSLRIFKAETKGLRDGDGEDDTTETQVHTAPVEPRAIQGQVGAPQNPPTGGSHAATPAQPQVQRPVPPASQDAVER